MFKTPVGVNMWDGRSRFHSNVIVSWSRSFAVLYSSNANVPIDLFSSDANRFSFRKFNQSILLYVILDPYCYFCCHNYVYLKKNKKKEISRLCKKIWSWLCNVKNGWTTKFQIGYIFNVRNLYKHFLEIETNKIRTRMNGLLFGEILV